MFPILPPSPRVPVDHLVLKEGVRQEQPSLSTDFHQVLTIFIYSLYTPFSHELAISYPSIHISKYYSPSPFFSQECMLVEMSYLRGACGVSRWDGVSNGSVYERCGMRRRESGVGCGVLDWV